MKQLPANGFQENASMVRLLTCPKISVTIIRQNISSLGME
jgi:hypothetical protein